MKRFLTITAILSFCATTVIAQEHIEQINRFEFIIKEVKIFDADDPSRREVQISRGTKNLLSHTLSFTEVDSSSEGIQLGSYEIEENQLIFYSYWAWRGDSPTSPYGVSKQVYEVKPDGRLILKNGEIYIEEIRQSWLGSFLKHFSESDYMKGIVFLSQNPENEGEKELLNNYIRAIEKKYHATFVYGENRKSLFTEVRNKLKKEIEQKTKSWESIDNSFGYQK